MKRARGQTSAFVKLGSDRSKKGARGAAWWEDALKLVRKLLVEAGSEGLTEAEIYKASKIKRGTISAALVYLSRDRRAFHKRKTHLRGSVTGATATIWVAEESYVESKPTQPELI